MSSAGASKAQRPYEIDDETGPLGVYGRTKLAGEFAVLAAMPDAHIVRTAWIYEGGDGGDFVAAMRRLAAGDETVDVVADQIGSPTYVADLVGALLEVADGEHSRTGAARRQRRRGQPLRAGAGGVRGRRRRSCPGAARSAATAIRGPRRGRRTRRCRRGCPPKRG